MSTWMVPSFVNVSFASGSVTSCAIQGFFGYFFYALSAASNASLAVSYCLIVKFGWRDNDKDRHRLSFTIIPIVCAMIISIVPLPGQNYNYSGIFFCDIAASPLGCDYPDTKTQCTRGAGARDMLLYVGVIPFMLFFAIIIAAVTLLIYSVLKQERRMDRYQREGEALNRSMTTQTTRQGIYYIAAFGLTWIPWYIYAILEFKEGKIPEALGIIHLTTMPLQGVLNALVYFRPKYKSHRASNPRESRVSSVLRVLKISLPAVNCRCMSKLQQKSDDTGNGTLTHRIEENQIEQRKGEELGKEGKIVVASNEDVMGDKAKASVVRFSDTAVGPSTINP